MSEVIKRPFPKEDLQALAWREHDEDVYEVIMSEISDTSRWSVYYEMVFKFDGKFYVTYYSKGATECQDESPYEYEPEEVLCIQVEPVEVTVTEYQPVNA